MVHIKWLRNRKLRQNKYEDCLANLHNNQYSYTITINHSDEEVKTPYEDLEKAITASSTYYTIITSGFNARMGNS